MKGSAAPKGIDEYLAGVPEPARSTLNRVRATIRSVAPPEATEAISYGISTFKYKGPLLGFAAFSPLQFVLYESGGDGGLQERTQGLPHL